MANKQLFPSNCAVIIINYNNSKDTIDCLASIISLAKQPKYIVVVDNGSSDNSAELICKALENTGPVSLIYDENYPLELEKNILIQLTDNDGFSAGNNAALKLLVSTDCDAFWLLNNDTIVVKNSLSTLCDRLNAKPTAAMCGSTLVHMDDKITVQCSAGAKFSELLGTTKFINNGLSIYNVTVQAPEQVESMLGEITGASILMHRSVVEECGLMDESYFLYREDSEWSIRVRKRGYCLAWAPQSVVYHKEGGTSEAKSTGGCRQRSLLVDFLGIRNRFYLMKTYYPWFVPTALLGLIVVFANRIRRGQADRIPMLVKAAIDGLRGKMGKPSV